MGLTLLSLGLATAVAATTGPTDSGASEPSPPTDSGATADTGTSADTGTIADTGTTTETGGGNGAPVSDAGPDDVVYVGDPATLDGSGSSDPDGDALTYDWGLLSVPSGSAIGDEGLDGASSPTVGLTPDAEGTYVLSLVVSDGLTLASDQVQLTALARDEGCGGCAVPGSAPSEPGVWFGLLALGWCWFRGSAPGSARPRGGRRS